MFSRVHYPDFGWLWLAVVLMGLLTPAFAGNGATHPVAGALFARYMSTNHRETANGKMLSYGSAFLLGMTSHLVSDHFGNYEPRTGSKEMVYFTAEGVAGMVLLLPQWKKDPRLFWGSLGGMFPDIEHIIKPFGRRVFPTHSGLVPHGERENFWDGAMENLILNGLALYVLYKNSAPKNGRPSRVAAGVMVNYWHTQGALKRGFPDIPAPSNGSLSPHLLLLFHVHDKTSVAVSSGAWMRRQIKAKTHDYPGRIVVNPYLVSLNLHPSYTNTLVPFVMAGSGIYVASESHPANKGNIAFARHRATSVGFHYGWGFKIRANGSLSLLVSRRYHDIAFAHAIDGSRNFSGWETGIGMVRGL